MNSRQKVADSDEAVTNKRNGVAGVVLCLNEVDNLPRCLSSLRWCDEVFVVDSGSTDASQEYARQMGATVLENRQDGQFLITEQRNWILSVGIIKSEWVLFLDADEEIGVDCRIAIEQSIKVSKGCDGFELTPRYWFLGRWLKQTQGYPNWHPRLLRRGAVWFEGGVWESFSGSNRIGRIQEPYEHYAFSKGIDDWLERHKRYAEWEAEKITRYLAEGNDRNLGTSRSLWLRKATAKAWPLKPLMRFAQKFIVQRGFLEGWQGLLFALLMATYDLITVVKIIEMMRVDKGEDL